MLASAEGRAPVSAALTGAGVGLALGAIYLAGLDPAAVARAQAQRAAATPLAVVEAVAFEAPAAGRLGHRATPRELDCLTQAVYFEARGETPRGQAAVAQVVLNRVRHPAYPKTVCGVVYQGARSAGCQFSFACDGSTRRGREADAWTRARKIAARALAGGAPSYVGTATHFHAVRVSPAWGSSMLRVTQVGLHVFYSLNGRVHRAEAAPRARPEHAVFVSAQADDAAEPATEIRLSMALAVPTDEAEPAAATEAADAPASPQPIVTGPAPATPPKAAAVS